MASWVADMFIVNITYITALDSIEPLLPAHRAWLDKYYTAGVFKISGPKNPRDGGVIIAEADNLAALESIMQEDPFTIAQISKYEIIEFLPNKHANSWESCIEGR